jgi:AIG2 family protein
VLFARAKVWIGSTMMLYFAYGSNMSRALMRTHCPAAAAVGVASLAGYRFVITADGYGSVVRHPGGIVQGVLWQLTPRDLGALNIYESVDSGLYQCRRLLVRHGSHRRSALIYIARPRGTGKPRPGYLELVIAAARDWGLSTAYVRELARWAPSGLAAARAVESGEVK